MDRISEILDPWQKEGGPGGSSGDSNSGMLVGSGGSSGSGDGNRSCNGNSGYVSGAIVLEVVVVVVVNLYWL